MGLQLKYPGVTLPDGVGQTFYAADGALSEGSLLLLDWSNPDCLTDTATDVGGAVNLAEPTLDEIVGAAGGLTIPASASLFELTTGKGMFKTLGGSSTAAYNIGRSSAFDAYLRANTPDVLTTFWVRITPADIVVNSDTSYFAPTTKVPALFRLNGGNDGTLKVTNNTIVPASFLTNTNDWLFQIAMSREEFFVNGQKAGDFDAGTITNYDTFVAGVGDSITAYLWLLRETGQGDIDGAFRFYRMMMEDLDVSGRTPLEAVQADYSYVINNASFVATV